jgi:hypothetical protein
MKKTNKILAIILAILMMVSIIPITASAIETEGSCKHFTEIIPEFAPTVTKPGLTAGIACSACGTVILEQQVIPALGTTDDPSIIVSGSCGTNAKWTYNTETNTLIISGTGSTTKYKSAQSRPWETYKNDIKSVVVNEGITKIDNYAFRNLTNLMYVSLPDSLSEIGNYVFRYCSSLRSIVIPNSVYSVGSEVFSYCTNLLDVTIGNNVTTIGDLMFNNCTSLTNITIPEFVFYIYESAFANCSNLKSVTIGENVSSIYNKAFIGCTALTDVYYTGTEEKWNKISIGTDNAPLENATIHFGSIIDDNGETHKHDYTIVTVNPTCTEKGYTSYTCECGYEYITNYDALGHNREKIPAVLPTTTTPGHTAKEVCSVCGEVYVEGVTVPVINETSYTTKSGDYLISVLDQSTDTLTVYGTGTIEYGHELDLFYYEPRNQKVHFNVDTLIITDGITGIGNDAFAYHPVISVVIADSVKTIGAEAFYGCEVLNSVEMGDGVTSIGDSAFEDCYYLTEVELGKNVKTIGKDAFSNCESLETFDVDDSNPHYSVDENGILYNGDKTELILCPQGSKVANYEMPSSVKEIRAGAFYKCKYLAHAVICDGVTTIPEEAFYRCENLESVVIPKSVTEIGEGAFDYWCGLSIVYYGGTEEEWKELTKSFTLLEGNNDSLIMATVYYNYKKLESASGVCGENLTWTFDADTATLTISGTGEMTEYGYDSDFPWHSYAKDIKKVIISDGVTSISSYAFEGFTGLTSVEIADSVTTIGEYSFAFCDSLKSITLPDSVTLIGDDVFRSCMNLSSVKLSKGLTVIPNSAFAYCINLVDITISDNIEIIGISAFWGCRSLENITLSKNLTEINAGTFGECYSLKAIDIPDSVTIICEDAFYYCLDLETVKIGKGVKTIEECAFYNCDYLDNVYYAGGEHDWNLIDIGPYFSGWLVNNDIHFAEAPGHSYTSEITTPATHTENGVITYTCSCGDSYTEAIEILEKHNYESVVTVPTCTEQGYTTYTCECGDSYVDDYVNALGHTDNDNDGFCDICDSLVYPDAQLCGEKVIWTFDEETGTLTIWGTGDMYDYTISSVDGSSDHPWADFRDEIKSIVIGDDVTSIGDSAFSDCDYLEEVKFGKNVKTIGGNAFSSCDSLTNFVIPEGVTEIGRYAFYVCKNLTSVTFPSTLTYIGIYAFCECNSLPSVVIPINVESIDSAAFYNCDNLKDVYYEGTEEQMSEILPLFSFTPIFSSAKRHYNSTGADTHPYKPVITPPTCTEQGYTTYICDCGYSNGVDDYVDALGHNHTSEITTPATHTETGVMTYNCACGDTYTETIDKLAEHNHNAVITAPTCTERGYTTYTCECGDSYVADYVDATGHTEEIITAVAPTCTETGLTEGAKCSACGETLTEQKELPENGHNPAIAVEENYIAPTCTEDGSKDVVIYCSVCDEEISRETETIEATGHADNDGDGYCDADNGLLDPSVECDHACHKSGIPGFFWKIINLFNKLFGINNTCSCGVTHY